MNINLPSKVRSAIYLLNFLGTPAISVFVNQKLIPEWAGLLWGAEVAAAMLLARINIVPEAE